MAFVIQWRKIKIGVIYGFLKNVKIEGRQFDEVVGPGKKQWRTREEKRTKYKNICYR